jgi:glycosyltransferase involved in cell wall biosynthesis
MRKSMKFDHVGYGTPELSVIIVSRLPREQIQPINVLDLNSSIEVEIIIRNDDGIGAARNAGIEEANADKLIFIDDDATPWDGYLEVASDRLDDHDIVAGRAVDPGGDYFSRLSDSLGYDRGITAGQTTQVIGCNMGFRRAVFDRVGYFDENVQFGHDETILIEKAREKFDIYYEPELCVTHRLCDSPIEFWKKWWNYGCADVYLARQRGNVVPERLHEYVPLRLDESVEGTTVLSIGKGLRLVNFLRTTLTGTGWETNKGEGS